MNELVQFLAQKGFNFTPVLGTDRPMRFTRTKEDSGWFIGKELTIADKTVLVAWVGDWASGERYSFQSTGSFTADEKAQVNEHLLHAAAAERQAREEMHEQTAEKAAKRWADLPNRGESPYFLKKGLNSLYGCKLFQVPDAVLTVVPLRDIQEKLWGLQYIHPSGKPKNFGAGTKIRGNFHLIGEIKEGGIIYVCEGVATGASIHDATGSAVACAFNAGNLEAVARELAGRYGSLCRLVLCGDEDRWTRRPDGNAWNPGREAAEAAARAIGAVAVFPRFVSLDDEPTDFNDLHAREGLEAVTAQLDEALRGRDEQAKESFIIPLGYAGDRYYLTSSSNPQINSFSDLSETDCYKLMPREWWMEEYGEWISVGKGKAAITKQVIDWAGVKSHLMSQCREAGFFENRRIRGSGVWLDQGKPVVHLGDRLWYEGADHNLRALPSEFIYEYGRKLSPVHERPLTLPEMGLFRDVVASLNYAAPEQQLFLGGWLAVASICGVLPWRPHIWVTGEQGAGKSTALDHIVKRFTSAFAQLHVQGATTEAGIRQSLRSNAVPVLFDEFESSNEKAAHRVEAVVELFRQASTDTGGVIAKGGASGESTEYVARFAGCVSSIGTNLVTGADKSRFTLVELKKLDQTPEQWERLQQRLASIPEEYPRRFFARMIQMAPVIVENQRLLQAAFAIRHSQRFGQQYGTLLAGWAAAITDGRLTADEVTALVDQVRLEQEISSNQTPDQEECLQHLRYSQYRLGDHTVSVSELLHAQDAQKLDWEALENQAWKDHPVWKTLKPQLAKLGILVSVRKDHGPGFGVMANHPELRKLFKDTRWSRNWAQALARVPGAIPNIQVRDMASERVRVTWIPAARIVGTPDQTEPSF